MARVTDCENRHSGDSFSALLSYSQPSMDYYVWRSCFNGRTRGAKSQEGGGRHRIGVEITNAIKSRHKRLHGCPFRFLVCRDTSRRRSPKCHRTGGEQYSWIWPLVMFDVLSCTQTKSAFLRGGLMIGIPNVPRRIPVFLASNSSSRKRNDDEDAKEEAVSTSLVTVARREPIGVKN
nr:60S ribosomal protein L31 [Ipomoea batatas]